MSDQKPVKWNVCAVCGSRWSGFDVECINAGCPTNAHRFPAFVDLPHGYLPVLPIIPKAGSLLCIAADGTMRYLDKIYMCMTTHIESSYSWISAKAFTTLKDAEAYRDANPVTNIIDAEIS